MQFRFAYPDEFGNSGNELFRGQSHGFTQNNQGGVNQGNNLNQGNLNQGNGMAQGGLQRNQTAQNNTEEQPRRRGRGFASMDPARVSEIASMGGKAAHEQGVAHEWTPEEARRAGRKGGQASRGTGSTENKTHTAGGGF